MQKLEDLELEDELVLDAGTGACGMTKILGEKEGKIVSVDMEREYLKDCRDQTYSADFIQADLSEMGFIESESFDHVFCKATISALSVNKSLFVTSVLREFYRILKDKGQLTIIDYYPFEEKTSPVPLDELQVEIWRLEKAVFELLGESHLEEYSPEALEDELLSIGFKEADHSIFRKDLPWSGLMEEHEKLILKDMEKIEDRYLREALEKKLQNIMDSSENKEIISGALFELTAKK